MLVNSNDYASDLKIILEAETGINFTNYFNEWYYGQGYPTYNLTYNMVITWL